MGLDFAAPGAFVGLLGLVALYRWHRRALMRAGRPFSAWYLVPGTGGDGGAAGRLDSPALFAARCAALVALVVAIAGPRLDLDQGTVVLTTGPVSADASWSAPVTVIRAGRPPSVEGDDFAPVVGPPAWDRAVALAAEVAPGARIRIATPPRTSAISSAGAALDGDGVVVTAVAAGTPRLVVGDVELPLERRSGDWMYAGPAPAGPAEVRVGDAVWPLCIPDTRPLAVADAGWPPAVDALLDVLPDVRRVPAADADWRPGPAPPRAEGWAPFAPPTTVFEFATEPTRAAAPLWFAERLTPPGAVVQRWRPLDGDGTPVLLAGDAVVADHGTGPAGAGRRFGFDPADTDLPATAGWPVLFADAVQSDRAARGRCRVHRADRSLVLAVEGPLTITDARGRRFSPPVVDGLARIDGLDAVGHARLESGGETAWVAVVPPAEGEVVESGPVVRPAPARQTPTLRRPLLIAALLALLVVLLLVGRGRGRVVAAALAAASGFSAAILPFGERRPPISVVVDTTASMPPAETRTAAAAVLDALGERITARWTAEGEPWADPAALTFTGSTLAPGLDGTEPGVMVLLTDGRDRALPRPRPGPALVMPITPRNPDARVVDGHAVQLGDKVFARATVVADRAGPARVRLGEVAVDVRLAPDRPQSVQAVLAAGSADTVELAVQMADDRQPGNDRRPTPIDGQRPPQAVVVGAGEAWARAAGLAPTVVPAGALGESGARLASARAMILHDQPVDAFDTALVTRLRRWVEAGGVLLLAGRTQAFGPGGWAGSPLDALSPLTADPRPPGAGPVAVALVLDRSGSIAEEAGGTGIEALGRLAGDVAAGLRPIDRLAVVAFGGEVRTLLPPTAIADLDPAGLPVPALARGGTRLAPALQRARSLLEPLPVGVRVVVLIGDGRVADADEARARGADLERAGVRVSGLLVGPDPEDAVFADLAQATDGEVQRADRGRLAVAVSSGVLAATGDAQAVEGGPVAAEPAWSGRVGGVPPPVAARVRVGARPAARVLARVGGEPLLAEWAVGEGRVLALATDDWALDAEQWSALWAPATAPRPRDVQITVEGGAMVYRGPTAEAPPTGPVRVRGPEGLTRTSWRPTGPGEARAPLEEGPAAVLEVSSATTRGAVVAPVVRPPPSEITRTGVDRDALAVQAALTGGAVVGDPGDLLAALDALPGEPTWPWAPFAAALAWALVLFDTWRWSGGRLGGRAPRTS